MGVKGPTLVLAQAPPKPSNNTHMMKCPVRADADVFPERIEGFFFWIFFSQLFFFFFMGDLKSFVHLNLLDSPSRDATAAQTIRPVLVWQAWGLVKKETRSGLQMRFSTQHPGHAAPLTSVCVCVSVPVQEKLYES